MRIGIISNNKEQFFEKYPALGEMIQVVDSGGWWLVAGVKVPCSRCDRKLLTTSRTLRAVTDTWSPGACWLNVQIGLQTH